MSSPNGSLQLQDIGEHELLKRVQQFCPAELVGDDGAILSAIPESQELVVTTDLLVDGVHFSDRTMTAADVGWKAAAANLSDLAAMGATPIGLTIGLALPPQQPVVWVEELYSSLVSCLDLHQTPIVGGDICRSPITTIAITALGTVLPCQQILRSQAQPGDVILTTGVHGASKAGLELLFNPSLGKSLSIAAQQALIQAHQRPSPRLDISQQLSCLQQSYPSPQGWRIAGMDSSDGLADAIIQICQMSGVGAHIERATLPLPQSFRRWLVEPQALQWCLYGGEDYELVLTMPPDIAQYVQQSLEQPLHPVGQITPETDIFLVDSLNDNPPIALNLTEGFQHFHQSS